MLDDDIEGWVCADLPEDVVWFELSWNREHVGKVAALRLRRCTITTVSIAMCCTTTGSMRLDSVATRCTWHGCGTLAGSRAGTLWKPSQANCWTEGAVIHRI